jgi:PAS domain S-box-containing protein
MHGKGEGSSGALDFLHGGGEMGAILRAQEWPTTPLGPIDGWPAALRITLAAVLASPFPMVLAWGPDLITFHNDAYRLLLGAKADALGRKFLEVWPEARSIIAPLIDRALAGEACRFEDAPFTLLRQGEPEGAFFDFAFSPVRDENGVVVGVLNTAVETTARVLAQRRQAFRLALEDRLRDLADPAEVIAAASEALGRHLDVAQVAYAEVEPGNQTVVIERDWNNGTMAGNRRQHRLDDYGQHLSAASRRGETIAISDVQLDERTSTPEAIGAFVKSRIAGLIDVPILKGRRLAAILGVHSDTPRAWSAEEIALAEEVAERTWSAAERANADEALRKSEARLRESEAHLKFAMEAGRLAEVTFYVDGRVTHSPAYAELLGHPADKRLTLEEIRAQYHPDDHDRAVAERAAILASGQTFYEIEKRIVRTDGQVRWIYGRGSVAMDERGVAVSATAVYIDETDRKVVEEALRESEARFRGVFNARLTGLTIFDARSGETLAINDTFLAMTGHTRADFDEGRWDWREFTVAEYLHLDEAAIAQARTRGWWDTFEKEYRRRDGSRFPVRLASAPLPGQPGRVVVWVQDISEARAAEAELRESEDRFRNMADHAPVMLWVTDPEARCTYLNRAWYDFTGQTPEQAAGLGWLEAVHPDDRSWSGEMFLAANARREAFRLEYRLRRRDGSYRWAIDAASPRYESSSEFLGYIGSVIDIHECKAAEELLEQRVSRALTERRDANALYRAYFENTPEALFVIRVEEDIGFVVEEVNPAHEVGIGLRLDDIRGRRIYDILPEGVAQRVVETYRHVVETGAIYQYREEFNLSGEPQHWDTSLVPMRDESDRIVRLIGSSRNVTRQVVAEEALRQSQKMEAMGQLTGGVAHDFNNLLTPIIGSLDMLARRGLGSERERRLIDGALQSAERAKILVQRLLAFARRQPLQAVAVDLEALIGSMAGLIGSTLGPQVDIRVELEPGLPPAVADPNQLEMALLNLAVNARDAMPEGGVLTIRAAHARVGSDRPALKPGHYVCLSVGDTGTGMDEATRSHAVEPFFSTKGIGKGTGLGLSMVHGLTAQLGGGLTVESAPGQGTNVELWLPVSLRPVELDGPGTSAPPHPVYAWERPARRRRRPRADEHGRHVDGSRL